MQYQALKKSENFSIKLIFYALNSTSMRKNVLLFFLTVILSQLLSKVTPSVLYVQLIVSLTSSSHSKALSRCEIPSQAFSINFCIHTRVHFNINEISHTFVPYLTSLILKFHLISIFQRLCSNQMSFDIKMCFLLSIVCVCECSLSRTFVVTSNAKFTAN